MKKFLFLLAGILLPTLGGCQLMWDAMGWSAVWSNPQYAELKVPAQLNISGIKVDGVRWTETGSKFGVSAIGPKPKLGGVQAIGWGWEINQNKINKHLSANIVFPIMNDSNFKTTFLSVSVADDIKSDSNEIYTNYLYSLCNGHGEPYEKIQTPPVPLEPIGKVILKQDYKHLTFSGAFKIPLTEIPRDPYMICKKGSKTLIRNPAPPATISIDEIRINIDSPVEYIWASKGGKEYRW